MTKWMDGWLVGCDRAFVWPKFSCCVEDCSELFAVRFVGCGLCHATNASEITASFAVSLSMSLCCCTQHTAPLLCGQCVVEVSLMSQRVLMPPSNIDDIVWFGESVGT